MVISDSEGTELVQLARTAVTAYLSESKIIKSEVNTDTVAGAFVTLIYLTGTREEHLRGCVGFPLPEKRLRQSVIDAAIAAATEDPRFPRVDLNELSNIIFEVSVLTPPEQLRCRPLEYRNLIRIGTDGLILNWKHGSGLLLPQVPLELNWDVDEYLAKICYKAGATPDAWLDQSSTLYRFQAAIFKETEPQGRVVRHGV